MKNKLVFDIGMHTGEDTIYYLKSGYDVVAVEANPVLAEECSLKFKQYISSGRLKILNVGIGPDKGSFPFYINKRLSVWSSFNKESATREGSEYEVVDVPCVTQEELFAEHGIPYYLKIDIEGHDHLALAGIPGSGEKPQFISFEMGDLAWLEIAKDKGYTKFKMINQLNHRDINMAREKSNLYAYYLQAFYAAKKHLPFLPFRYQAGSSGPFAHQLRGKWHSYKTIRKKYMDFMAHKAPNSVTWCDIHATFGK